MLHNFLFVDNKVRFFYIDGRNRDKISFILPGSIISVFSKTKQGTKKTKLHEKRQDP